MSRKKPLISFLFAIAAAVSIVASAGIKDEIEARTAPIGELCMAGEPCAAAPVVVASGPRGGEDIYNSRCLACHSTGAAGAPKLGDVAAWSARLAKGTDVLYANSINGINGMPAKGLCMDCSDEEIKITVDYMISQSQ